MAILCLQVFDVSNRSGMAEHKFAQRIFMRRINIHFYGSSWGSPRTLSTTNASDLALGRRLQTNQPVSAFVCINCER